MCCTFEDFFRNLGIFAVIGSTLKNFICNLEEWQADRSISLASWASDIKLCTIYEGQMSLVYLLDTIPSSCEHCNMQKSCQPL